MNLGLAYTILTLLFVLIHGEEHGEDNCFAEPKVGKIVGSFYGVFPSCVYKGIPYAEPPVGKLRFRPTMPLAKSLRSPFYATEYGAGCIQSCELQHPELTCPRNTSEDCLYLNIYTPQTSNNQKTGLPVLVFIHGGNYITGTGGCLLYHGSRWAHNQDAVIVTINYRLGVLGGLYTKRAGVDGNFQLMDQREALKWVSQNIEAFGGNPSLVTIFGQSAGGFSVASHLASPKSWQYFKRAVVHSDPIALPTEHESKLKIISDKIVEKLECNKYILPEDELHCLQSISAKKILEAQLHTSFPLTRGVLHAFMPWTPVVNKDELPVSPLEAAKKGMLPEDVSIMVGTVTNESIQFIWQASPNPLPKDEFKLYIESIFGIPDAERIFKLYGDPPRSQVANGDVRNFMSVIGTDYIFTCSNKRFGLDASKTNPNTFIYLYDHLLSYNSYLQGKWHPECYGWICHGSDLPILFSSEYLEETLGHPRPTFNETILGEQMRTMWTNFALSGDPNHPNDIPSTSNNRIEALQPFSSNSDPTIIITTKGTHQKSNILHYECQEFDRIGYEKN